MQRAYGHGYGRGQWFQVFITVKLLVIATGKNLVFSHFLMIVHVHIDVVCHVTIVASGFEGSKI